MRIPEEPLFWKLEAITRGNDALYIKFMESVLIYAKMRDTMLRHIQEYLKPDSVFYDVGGHVGFYSIVVARALRNGKVYTFEPNPRTYKTLERNVVLMPHDSTIIPRRVAIGDKIEQLNLNISSSSARSSFYPDLASYAHNSIKSVTSVSCMTLDSLGYDLPDTIKIDTEGYECNVLRGAEKILRHKHPQLFIEFHHEGDKEWAQSYLLPMGYQWEELTNDKARPLSHAVRLWHD